MSYSKNAIMSVRRTRSHSLRASSIRPAVKRFCA